MDFNFEHKDQEEQQGASQQPEMQQPETGAPRAEAPQGEPDAPQAGWNAAPQTPQQQDAPQAGWNAEPEQPQHDAPQAGWNAEPRTPYQTPVRYESYEEWRRSQQAQQPGAQGEAPQQGPAAPNGFSTYEEWQRQQMAAKVEAKPPRAKKSHKKVWATIGGVAAACLLLAAGIGIGSTIGDDIGGGTPVASDTRPVDPSKPSLNITDTSNTGAAAADDGLSGEAIYEKVSPSVVSIVASSLTSQGQASGSGVIMSSDGYVITNAHVVTDENTNQTVDKVTVMTADGMQHAAEIIGVDHQTDLAVLRITDGGTFTPAEFGDSSKIKAGEKAYAIGSPGGVQLANSITSGSISAISRDITIDDRVMTLIQTDASINPGNSGGALINKYGQVIGITSAKLGISYYEGLGFAIPIDSAKEVVDQIIQFGHVVGRPAIGVTGYNLSKEAAEYNNVPQGVVVTEVDSRSDAAAKGLQSKDIIVGVNGETITTMDEINDAKNNLKAGDSMTLSVYRISTGKTFDITITLSDQADLQSNTAEAPQQQQQQPNDGSRGYYSFPWGY